MNDPALQGKLRRFLQHRRDDAAAALANRVTQLEVKASIHGALGSGRFVLQVLDASKDTWRELVDSAMSDVRGFVSAKHLTVADAVPVFREELEGALGHLLDFSKLVDQGSGRYPTDGVKDEVERVWSELPAYLELRITELELGLGPQIGGSPTVTYAIQAHTISGNVQQGAHQSMQTSVVSGDTLLSNLTSTIQSEIADGETQAALLELVRELSETKGTPGFLNAYQRFMTAAANHVTVLAPFLPALAQMLG
ncbi:hypothetical protein ABDK56_00750 [Sphingomonas sp. ASV193]|uniref:hypothetical protein n=1 Tax=Sphingomonas sp. ASV193 TaxID=3144405 RepID=UPI0032E855ED